MLPDIRLVITAVATTVLILVGIGLMASVRITHQGLTGGSLVSSQADSAIGSRTTWPPLSEHTLLPHHETADSLATEERDLAVRVLANATAPAPAEERTIDPQTAAQIISEPEIAFHRERTEAAEPETTASITPPEPKEITAPAETAKKASAPRIAGKRTARARPRMRTAGPAAQLGFADRPARARPPSQPSNFDDQNLLEIIFGFDQTH